MLRKLIPCFIILAARLHQDFVGADVGDLLAESNLRVQPWLVKPEKGKEVGGMLEQDTRQVRLPKFLANSFIIETTSS